MNHTLIDVCFTRSGAGLKIVLPTAQMIPITAHEKEERHASGRGPDIRGCFADLTSVPTEI